MSEIKRDGNTDYAIGIKHSSESQIDGVTVIPRSVSSAKTRRALVSTEVPPSVTGRSQNRTLSSSLVDRRLRSMPLSRADQVFRVTGFDPVAEKIGG